MKPRLIGIGYRARSGKDTVATHLHDEYGYVRKSLAKPIKDFASTITGTNAHADYFKEESTMFGITGGELLQKLGMAGREVHPAFWMLALRLQELIATTNNCFVIPDVRFPNEAAEIKRLGGQLWRIDRPGLAYDPHPSEVSGADIKWDVIIKNDSTIATLISRVNGALACISCGVTDSHSAPPAP